MYRGGFSANSIPSGIDPLLAGFTFQTAANVLDPAYVVNLSEHLLYGPIFSSKSLLSVGNNVTGEGYRALALLTRLKLDEDAEQAPDLRYLTAIESG
ncbi:AbgT family transporter [Vibrio lentus]|nr:AbgT family transporter [Vibrio lentus]